MSAIRIMQLNGRVLYLKATTDLSQLSSEELRVLDALSRQGDTVVIAVGPDGEHIRLSYRMPDLENAVAFELDGLRGLIRQWSVWAAAQAQAA